MANLSTKARWLVSAHHGMRASSFATVFVATCIHIAPQDYSMAAWAYLIALLLIYPQMLYWRLLRSTAPIAAAMHALVLDSVLLGAFCAAVGFSDWLTFSVVLGTLSNSAANKGWRSIGLTLLALAAGALFGVALGGFHFSPHTGWQASVLCMVGLGIYVLAVGHIAYNRNVQLRSMREQLRNRERELLQANATLQTSLAEIEGLRKGLLEQANQDGLTGLFNRRYLDNTLERELARCKRESMPLSLMMLDLDHFKKYNDRYGHLAGDECLKAVGRALKHSARRPGDLAARYGGEEFSLVLPNTHREDALRMAETLRQEIEALAIAHTQGEGTVVTISVGLAVMKEHNYASADQLMRAADDALYYAKWGGRNRVHAAPESASRMAMDPHTPRGVKQLVWHEAFACGDAETDTQHAQLFVHTNAVLDAIRGDQSIQQVDPLIDQLLRSVVAHFEHEEGVLDAIGFPDAAEHAAVHRELLKRAVELVSQYREEVIHLGALLEFLTKDLIANHMLGADRKYLAYIPDALELPQPDRSTVALS
jgi:diguanylate cyclase (GGDEF)-like protein/hemerythrin-like metal-binding protein